MKYQVGFCQFAPKLMKVDENLETVSRLLENIEADLLVLPELALSGYVFQDKNELLSVAEDANDGKTAAFFRSLAKKRNTSYIIGFPELCPREAEPLIYNASMLINPDGSTYVYRKLHLFNREKLLFAPGDGNLNVYPAKNGVKVGMMICFDWIFPESARLLALNGAQIICHPSNLVLPWCQQAMITRSIENRVFTITSNRIGTETNGSLEMTFTGQSQLTSPQGVVIKRFGIEEEGVYVTEIDPEEADNKMVTDFNHLFNDRRKDKYPDLL